MLKDWLNIYRITNILRKVLVVWLGDSVGGRSIEQNLSLIF